MVKERCLKKTFQDSLEDIKERMKEKRAKGLAKVVKVKAYSSKAVKMNNNSVSVRSFQENNTELALALEAEKAKSRQAQDLILHLKREHQRLMFEIFMLRRKLTSQNGRESADNKLSSLKCIIAKVTCNLLETAKLLGPAQALCLGNSTSESSTESKKQSDDIGTLNPLRLHPSTPDSEIKGPSIDTEECEEDENLNCKGDDLENSGCMTSMAKGGRSCSYPACCKSDVENLNVTRIVSISHLHRHVSTRRRRSNLNVCKEESAFLEDGCLNADVGAENLASVGGCTYTNSGGIETVTIPSPSKEEFIPDSEMSNVASSTPEPRREKMPLKTKEPRTGREKARRGRTDKGAGVPLKKPWENTKSRTRSRSRERGTNKQTAPSEKMNTSLNSGDAYDFVFEESVHVTPFRQNKQEDEDTNEICSVKSDSEDDLDDSLYVPYKENARNRSCSDSSTSVPLRPRSKRRIVQQQQKKENKNVQEEQANIKKTAKNVLKANLEDSVETPTNLVIEDSENVLPAYVDAEGSTSGPIQPNVKCEKPDLITDTTIKPSTDKSATPPTPRFSLSDVTNLSGCSNVKKLSCPLLNKGERKTYASPTRKRRCTVTVNYAEPKLSGKLRRGDRFTDTEFLNSPIYKQKDAQKSLRKNSLSRYNEAFVGCSR